MKIKLLNHLFNSTPTSTLKIAVLTTISINSEPVANPNIIPAIPTAPSIPFRIFFLGLSQNLTTLAIDHVAPVALPNQVKGVSISETTSLASAALPAT